MTDPTISVPEAGEGATRKTPRPLLSCASWPVRWVLGAASIFVLILAIAILITVAPRLLTFPFWPAATKGSIYVESPEVYTRERLVNDRYDQDHWLRSQLARLDESRGLFDAVQSDRLQATFGRSPTEEDAESPPGDLTAPSFGKEFLIRSAVRDTIRQMILENMLDDRHDLTGNSVYGLKFDTTIIPGANTHNQAFVRVAFRIDPLPEITEGSAAPAEDTNGAHQLSEFFDYDLDEIESDPDNPFHDYWRHYQQWMTNVAFRLNSHVLGITEPECDSESRAPGVDSEGPVEPVEIALSDNVIDAVSNVLGIDRRRIAYVSGGGGYFKLGLPSPWDNFVAINVTPNKDCPEQPLIGVQGVFNSVFAVEADDWEAHGADLQNQFFVVTQIDLSRQVSESGNSAAVHYVIIVGHNWTSPIPTPEQYNEVRLRYKLTPTLLDAALKRPETTPFCLKPAGDDSCTVTGRPLFLHTGLFNFIRILSRYDAYSYAIFPRQDVTGVLVDEAIRATIQLVTGRGGVSAASSLREARTAVSLVNYGDGGLRNDRIELGWVVTQRELNEPVQKSQLALVSVPAWIDSLTLDVTTGWLDRESKELPDGRPNRMEVRLPPDYEAFDTLVSQNEARLQPAIFDKLITRDIVVRACQPAEILIPGARLWRSSAVTLGGQPADRITVLPNMRGILAWFREVSPPAGHSKATAEQPSAELDLLVWTSEGVDKAKDPVKVVLPEGGVCPEKDAME